MNSSVKSIVLLGSCFALFACAPKRIIRITDHTASSRAVSISGSIVTYHFRPIPGERPHTEIITKGEKLAQEFREAFADIDPQTKVWTVDAFMRQRTADRALLKQDEKLQADRIDFELEAVRDDMKDHAAIFFSYYPDRKTL